MTSDNTISIATDILKCPEGKYPLLYLGLPLKTTSLTRSEWQPLIDKVERRLDAWKGNCLSRGGRLTLVNAVLTSIPLYYMSFFILPKWVIQRIEKIRRSFLWKGTKPGQGGIPLARWELVCQPKRQGGLGIINLHSFNRSLITKWWWRVLHETHLPWTRIIISEYYGAITTWSFHEKTTKRTSPLWRGVTKVADLFQIGVRFACGDGNNIRFWTDLWLGEQPLGKAFPSLFEIANAQDATIADHRHNDRWVFEFRQILSQQRTMALGSFWTF